MEHSAIHPTQFPGHHPGPHATRAARIKAFAWHLFQMIVAMEVGMLLYHVAFGQLLAPDFYKPLAAAYPLADYWMMTVAMIVPMLLVMRYHKSSWGYCLGMTGAMAAPAGLLTALAALSLISLETLTTTGGILMTLGMLIYMLCRRR